MKKGVIFAGLFLGFVFLISFANASSQTIAVKEIALSSDSSIDNVNIYGGDYVVELISASDSAAVIKVTDSAGLSEAKEINEGSSKTVNNIPVSVSCSDESPIKLSAVLHIGDIYSFDNIEVLYAAKFTANPTNIEPNNWIVTEVSGGINNPIDITYGVVNLRNGVELVSREEFVKIDGTAGSKSFLFSSVKGEGINNNYNISTLFWSGRTILGNLVVADYSQSIEGIVFKKIFDTTPGLPSYESEYGNLINIELNGQYSSGSSTETERTTMIGTNIYEADMNTLIKTGNYNKALC